MSLAAAAPQNNLLGALCAMAAATAFSINDTVVKFLSSDYALYQVVLMRALVALPLMLAVLYLLRGNLADLRTRRPLVHVVRGGCLVIANMCFFLALAAMPIAEVTAIFFISPLLITALSVVVLGETVGARRWLAVGLGFVGVLVMLRPGTGAFQLAALLPLGAATFYAIMHIMTRRIGGTESAVAMAFYIQIAFIVISCLGGLGLGHGRFDGAAHPSLDFLLRAWVWPDRGDLMLLGVLGLCSAAASFLISQAYRVAEVGLAAPFEYIALPLAIVWGVLVFGDWPDGPAWSGIGLIMGSGLYLLWREAAARRRLAGRQPQQMR